MLQDWDKNHPGRIESMFTAIKNVVPSHLCDSELFDFKGINANSGIIDGGDTAFDQETFTSAAPEKTAVNIQAADLLNVTEIK
jgi:tRNA 2-thiocytidine biosynthesis protein TtcA